MTDDQIFLFGLIALVVVWIYGVYHEVITKLIIKWMSKPLQKIVFLVLMVCGIYACGNGLYHMFESVSFIIAKLGENDEITRAIKNTPTSWLFVIAYFLWTPVSVIFGGLTAFLAWVHLK